MMALEYNKISKDNIKSVMAFLPTPLAIFPKMKERISHTTNCAHNHRNESDNYLKAMRMLANDYHTGRITFRMIMSYTTLLIDGRPAKERHNKTAEELTRVKSKK